MEVSSSLIRFGLVLLVSSFNRVEPLLCNHTVLPSATSANHKVELLLNCSSNKLSVTTIFNIPHLMEYTILYTCIHRGLPEPIQRTAIFNAIVNKTKSLDQVIPCGSLCTFGGCYSSGTLGNVVDLSISPLQSCIVCEGGMSGVCMTELDSNNTCDESYTQCIPSLNLNNGTVHCNCEDCPTTSSTAIMSTMDKVTGSGVVECTCICTLFSEGYSCKCSSVNLNSSPFPCSSVSRCELQFCDAGTSDCGDTEDINHCFCSERNGYNCTSMQSSAPINVLVASILVASILLISCATLCFFLTLCSILSRKKEARPVIMDSAVFDEIFTFDPVDVAVPNYQLDEDGSFSTLLHSFDMLSSVKKQPRSTSSLSNHTDSCMDSECHLSDAEGYVMCGDSACSSSSEVKKCQN